MLYLDSFENAEDDRTERKFAICAICPSMPNIMELVPSKELLAQWQSQEISWEEFREQFFEEMRAEYGTGEESRLRGLTKYSLENDVTLYSPEPNGEHTYRAILEEIINIIWKEEERTDRVINLAREPVEALQTEADQGQMETIPQEDEQKSELQEDFARFISEMSKTNENIKSLQEMITTKDEQIQSLQAKSGEKDRKNDELKRQIDQLEEKISNQQGEIQSLKDANCELEEQVNRHEKTIDDFHRTLSKQQGEIQSLRTEGDQKDIAKSELQEEIDSLHQINATNTERIRSSAEKISTKDKKIQLLQAKGDQKDGENAELKTQITQLQDINTHRGIRDIAVEATGIDPVFGEYFRTLDIDKNLPETLRNWLIMHLRIDPNSRKRLPTLIREYADFGEFDEYDVQLAHAIRTQRELIAYRKSEIDERTIMGRALCCVFAAALLSPKLPEPKQPAFK